MKSFYRALLGISALIIVLVFVEKLITRNMFRQKYKLPTDSAFIKIKTPYFDLPCYVYRSKVCECIKKMSKEELDLYEKHEIPSHLAKQLRKRLRNTKDSAKAIFTSGVPINSMIKTIANGVGIISSVDPTVPAAEEKWRILIPKGERLNCFIDDGYLYIM